MERGEEGKREHSKEHITIIMRDDRK
ncbi:hypothetical protein CAEBREN_14900 [Caenorhabditis brenneri]|uniref:Uncharacterized protein n=1 Tax=Caenorhabditis brenneri TaxID=135651 RepID=G0MSS5_CAEBE|nr:hypothetical protein CAEBREN_14900 [Caenorhabditis brenneri]